MALNLRKIDLVSSIFNSENQEKKNDIGIIKLLGEKWLPNTDQESGDKGVLTPVTDPCSMISQNSCETFDRNKTVQRRSLPTPTSQSFQNSFHSTEKSCLSCPQPEETSHKSSPRDTTKMDSFGGKHSQIDTLLPPPKVLSKENLVSNIIEVESPENDFMETNISFPQKKEEGIKEIQPCDEEKFENVEYEEELCDSYLPFPARTDVTNESSQCDDLRAVSSLGHMPCDSYLPFPQRNNVDTESHETKKDPELDDHMVITGVDSATSLQIDQVREDKRGLLQVGWGSSFLGSGYSDDESELCEPVDNESKTDDGLMFEDFPVYRGFSTEDEDDSESDDTETADKSIEEEFDSRRPWRKAPLDNDNMLNWTETDDQSDFTDIYKSDCDILSVNGNEVTQPLDSLTKVTSYNSIIDSSDISKSPGGKSISVSSEITEVNLSKNALLESQLNMNGINRNRPRLFRRNKLTPQKFPQFMNRKEKMIQQGLEHLTKIQAEEGNNNESVDSKSNYNSDKSTSRFSFHKTLRNNSLLKPIISTRNVTHDDEVVENGGETIIEENNETNSAIDSSSKNDCIANEFKNKVDKSDHGRMLKADGLDPPIVMLSGRDIVAAGGNQRVRQMDNIQQIKKSDQSPSKLTKDQSEGLKENGNLVPGNDGKDNFHHSISERSKQTSQYQVGRKIDLIDLQKHSGKAFSVNSGLSHQIDKNLVDQAFRGFPIMTIRHRGRFERKFPRLWRYRKGLIIGILAFFLVAGTGIVLIQFSYEATSDSYSQKNEKTKTPTFSPSMKPYSTTPPPIITPSVPLFDVIPKHSYVMEKEINGIETSSRVGTSLSFSSNGYFLAVGSATDMNVTSWGFVSVYKYVEKRLIQFGSNLKGNTYTDDFGCSLSLSSNGKRLAIGAKSSSSVGKRNGSVYIYQFDPIQKDWSQLGMTIHGKQSEERSGWSVSISGNGIRVAIGSPRNGNSTYPNDDKEGSVSVYEYSEEESNWFPLGQILYGPSHDSLAGYSVALSDDGNHLVFGVLRSLNIDYIQSGHVEVHQYITSKAGIGSWVKIGKNIEGVGLGDEAGRSVSISTNSTLRIAIGVKGFDDMDKVDTGCCRIFDYRDTLDGKKDWVQVGSDLIGDLEGEESGTSVSLSGNGQRVACGGPKSIKNGSRSGVARVFDYDEANDTWLKVGNDLIGQERSKFGSSVELTGDGNSLAVAGPSIVSPGKDSGGIVRIYGDDKGNNQ